MVDFRLQPAAVHRDQSKAPEGLKTAANRQARQVKPQLLTV